MKLKRIHLLLGLVFLLALSHVELGAMESKKDTHFCVCENLKCVSELSSNTLFFTPEINKCAFEKQALFVPNIKKYNTEIVLMKSFKHIERAANGVLHEGKPMLLASRWTRRKLRI